jgi:exopolyphosphatase/guanosine-5'-triphosphate,3'-diphosphate pyrophosphatase
MDKTRFAAIDIGSNAVRLLLTGVIDTGTEHLFKKECLVRMPLRLGDDAFLKKRISESKAASLVKTMRAFKHLIDAYEAVSYKACATSALREAVNGNEVVKRVREESEIEIDIIDGRLEAELVCLNHPESLLKSSKPYLYVDVGGGSTDMTLIEHGEIVDSASINIGTLRLLNDLVKEETWKLLKQWTKSIKKKHKAIVMVGSGGNINKLFSMARIKTGNPLTYKRLMKLRNSLAKYTIDERIGELNLRPDRADVIVPGADIFLAVMKWSGARRILVPQIGLADGLVHMLYNQHLNGGRLHGNLQPQAAIKAN